MQRFDPAWATARLVDSLGATTLARSESYTRGANLLLVGGGVLWVVVAWLAIRTGAIRRLAAIWQRRSPLVQTFAVTFVFFVAADLVRLPWAVFSDWWYGRAFGLSTQSLGDFIGQTELSSLIEGLIVALFVAALFALIRKVGGRWWMSAGGVTAIALVAFFLAVPVVVEPLFNAYQPVPQGPARERLERVADRAGIPHDRIFQYDGSRQSGVFSANVSGIGPAARIAISDTALRRATLDEVEVVTAHEAGHYMLGHVWRQAFFLPLLAILLFALVQALYPRAARLLGSNARLGDAESLPVFVALVSALALAASPAVNTLTRIAETGADRYALETTGLPDALASALLKTAEYRYPRPSRVEELVFYSHPSLERRIRAAMEWKAKHAAPPVPGSDRKDLQPLSAL